MFNRSSKVCQSTDISICNHFEVLFWCNFIYLLLFGPYLDIFLFHLVSISNPVLSYCIFSFSYYFLTLVLLKSFANRPGNRCTTVDSRIIGLPAVVAQNQGLHFFFKILITFLGVVKRVPHKMFVLTLSSLDRQQMDGEFDIYDNGSAKYLFFWKSFKNNY